MRILCILLPFIVFISCTSQDSSLQVTGTIEEQGITSYQYGTHMIVSDTTLYALRSENISLDSFVQKRVKIWGQAMEGYPVEGGPPFVEVNRIEIIQE